MPCASHVARPSCPARRSVRPRRPSRVSRQVSRHFLRHRMRPLVLALALAACGRAPAPARASVVAPAPPPVTTPAAPAARGELRTATLWSPSLGVAKAYRVWLPPGYARDTARRYPVAFYLHGLFGAETDWTEQGALAATLDSMSAAGLTPMLVVMPDGDDSWYTTSNALVDAAACRRAKGARADADCVPWWRYDEYVARDLVRHVDSAYRTVATRDARALAGLSMGGYGAVTLALRYPDVFATAASHSGVLSPMYDGPAPFVAPARYATTPARLREKWARFWSSMGPAFGRDTVAWHAREPVRLVERARAAGTPIPALWFDAGRDDALVIDQNRAFAWELDRLGVAHEWHERDGKHDWRYWRTNAPHSLAWIAGRIGGR